MADVFSSSNALTVKLQNKETQSEDSKWLINLNDRSKKEVVGRLTLMTLLASSGGKAVCRDGIFSFSCLPETQKMATKISSHFVLHRIEWEKRWEWNGGRKIEYDEERSEITESNRSGWWRQAEWWLGYFFSLMFSVPEIVPLPHSGIASLNSTRHVVFLEKYWTTLFFFFFEKIELILY